MQPSHPPSAAPANPQKARTGLNRIWHAAGYSLEGLRAGWNEKAFRQGAIGAMVLLPLSLWLGRNCRVFLSFYALALHPAPAAMAA